MASNHWYLRWNTRLASQCTAPAKGQQQRGIQEQQKGSQELANGRQVTQEQQGAREQVILKHILQKRGQENKEQSGQHTGNRIQQEGTRNLYKEQHHVSSSQGVQEPVRRGQDQQSEIGKHQKRVHAGEKRMKEQPRSPDGKEASPPSCDDASYVSEVCRRSPLHVAKVVRLSLRRVVPLIEDPHLPLQVVYLVRDPRAVLSSRSRLPWCIAPACRDPHTVCSSLQKDLHLLPHLLRRYPTRIKMVLYEEFLQGLPSSLHDLLAFLHLPFSSTHLAFINASKRGVPFHPQEFSQRTQGPPGHAQGTYGTSRNLKYQAFLWRLNTPYKQASRYQAHCRAALTSLGLRQFTSSLQYHTYSLPALLPRPRRPHT
ncbi:carbohydrate sulfotransferase 5-like isoform X2 [Eriocheir sinensis]|uniref:carbohydrate sulfotransferase 5-like isoform X2 n=1 Tax=Eriocheir sinensis TaxID=95602 RepID=UPI0021C59EB0|nr:carbohydrate sulfotransferase 5-like isoform X2 [Eriocheir sinensis]